MRKNLFIALLLSSLALLFFFNTISLGFFSDDFFVMHRLTIEKTFWAPGFFRPISDISLLANYYFFNYHAWGYRVTNLLLHILNAFLLYKTTTNYELFNGKKNTGFSFTAALLFIAYPYHSESIIWIVGRASLLANTLGILALYFFSCKLSYKTKMLLVSVCYFAAMGSYESVMIIPGVIFLIVIAQQKKLLPAFVTMIPLSIALITHLIMRKAISGIIFGNYGIDMFGEGQTNYLLKFIKAFGRLFIPGMHNSSLFSGLLILVILLFAASFYLIYKYRRDRVEQYTILCLMLMITMLIPTMFGVDTHTTDGDRLLYLPSFFICVIFSYQLHLFIANTALLRTSVMLVLAVFFCLQLRVNKYWIKADNTISLITNTIKKQGSRRQIYLVNLPESIEGSFVFRNGFHEAMVIKQIPDSNVVIVNKLATKDIISEPDTIVIETVRDMNIIAPEVKIIRNQIFVDRKETSSTSPSVINRKAGSILLYWNKHELKQLPQ